MPSIYAGNMTRPAAFMKLGQIIMLLIVIIMVEVSDHTTYLKFTPHVNALLYGIVVGFLIVYPILIVCYLIGETTTQRSTFELLLNAVGSILFFSLSIKLFVVGSDAWGSAGTQIIVVGVFLLLISACQVVDAVFNFRARSNS